MMKMSLIQCAASCCVWALVCFLAPDFPISPHSQKAARLADKEGLSDLSSPSTWLHRLEDPFFEVLNAYKDSNAPSWTLFRATALPGSIYHSLPEPGTVIM